MANQTSKQICPYCGVGCGLTVDIDETGNITVHGMQNHPHNKGDICALGATLPFLFEAEGRLTDPLIRQNGELAPVDWDTAIGQVATKFNEIIAESGPDALAFYGGASNLNEEYYLMSKLFKGCIGTNNVECSTRLCMVSSAMGFLSTFGADAPPACYEDIEAADLFFIAGNNMAVSMPVLFRRVLAAKKSNPAKVIVVDPRRTGTAAIADIHLQIKPGTDVALNNTLAHIILEEGLVDEETVESYASGLTDLKQTVEAYSVERGARITGCPKEQIIEAARAIGKTRAMLTFWFQGYNHSTQALFKNNTLHNLSLLTGNICRPGAGPLSMTGEANALGNRWVGSLSHLLPGMRLVSNFAHRQEVADFWSIPEAKLQPVPGRSILEIIEGLHSGEVRALWITTTNPAVSLPDSNWVREGLSKAELLVVQDIFHPTETTMLADVVLPGAQWLEKTGTFISSERRIELIEKMIDPPGRAKPDYEIICLMARAMGFDKEFSYSSPEEIFEEFKGLTRERICDMNGISYERLRGNVGIQIPCPEPNHPGTARLFTDRLFARPDGRAALVGRDYIEPSETPDNAYPLVLITGRLISHFNTRTRTGRIPRLNEAAPDNIVEIHAEDAARLGISEGDQVEVTSRRGTAQGAARLTNKVLPGNIYMNMHYGELLGVGTGQMANLVCNRAYDLHSKQPEYKFCAVKIEGIDGD